MLAGPRLEERTLRDLTLFLWLLKLGAPINLYFLARTVALGGDADPRVVVPAQIFFAVSAYRCVFPVRYEGNVVLHRRALSSIFLTRLLATASEVAFVFLLSHVLRVLDVEGVGWVRTLSGYMVAQVVVSQCFVWAAILTGRLVLYWWEELGWALLVLANTIASAYLLATAGALGGREVLLELNLLFGVVYLPWQAIHLRTLRAEAREGGRTAFEDGAVRHAAGLWSLLRAGLVRATRVRNPRRDARAWGGLVGVIWMAGYWAILLPVWVYEIASVLSR